MGSVVLHKLEFEGLSAIERAILRTRYYNKPATYLRLDGKARCVPTVAERRAWSADDKASIEWVRHYNARRKRRK
jgi:hypothetical protein